jgi:PiT family inorganic phosphate transporter
VLPCIIPCRVFGIISTPNLIIPGIISVKQNHLFMFGLSLEMSVLLAICLIAAFAFEFINGFHDTANSVATIIYTKSMKPAQAVIWSGIWNFLGVYIGGIAVAMGIVNLLSNTVLLEQDVYQSIAMILSLVLTAIFWNLGTWYLGIPCSSSHTLIGSIFGVGIAYVLLPDTGAVILNWSKVKDVVLSLLISPIIGFGLAIAVMVMAKKYTNKKIKDLLFEEQPRKKGPPLWLRGFLILTSTLLSFSHGSNDGQKGVGLIMIILIALVPAKFALDNSKSMPNLSDRAILMEQVVLRVEASNNSIEDKMQCQLIKEKLADLNRHIAPAGSNDSIVSAANLAIRKDILTIKKEVNSLLEPKYDRFELIISKKDRQSLKSGVHYMTGYIEYSPIWVILMISIALGVGTMIGWKRIVITVGEKIGKEPLSYAQGASANLVAATTIGLSTMFGVPVSTTHVLSSGVAGSMVATKGIKNLRMKTVRGILIAWLITLPVTIIIAGLIFLFLRWLI